MLHCQRTCTANDERGRLAYYWLPLNSSYEGLNTALENSAEKLCISAAAYESHHLDESSSHSASDSQ